MIIKKVLLVKFIDFVNLIFIWPSNQTSAKKNCVFPSENAQNNIFPCQNKKFRDLVVTSIENHWINILFNIIEIFK